MNRRTRAASLVGTTLLSVLLLAGCSGSSEDTSSGGGETPAAADDGSTDSGDISGAQLDSGVPAECLDAFPVAFGEPDLAAATLLPADWPTDVVDGTLCQTSATGSGLQTIDWATASSAVEVLDAIEEALPSSYSVTREDMGMGEQLDGTAGDIVFTVVTRPGAYTLQLGRA